MRAVLIGCVAGKSDVRGPTPAADLYSSPLWSRRRAYAEASGLPWAILSARHGLLQPEQPVHSYDDKLKPAAIADWSAKIRGQLKAWLRDALDDATLEVHAGRAYVDGLERTSRYLWTFEHIDVTIEAPLAGLGIGHQLAWYPLHRHGHPAPSGMIHPTTEETR